MHPDSALITFVLDESGSMAGIADSAREGFNEYLDEQIEHGGPARWTLTTFSSRPHTRFAAIPGEEVRRLTRRDYRPGGVTALYDAVGEAVTKTRRYLERLRGQQPSDVIVVILTDGFENASRSWTWERVVDAITEAEDSGWQFVFLGANQDSWAVSQHLGIKAGAVVDWAVEKGSAKRAFKEAASVTSDYRKTKTQQRRYSDRRKK